MLCWANNYCKKTNTENCIEFCEGYTLLQILYKYSNIPIKYQYSKLLQLDTIDETVYENLIEIINDPIPWVENGNSLYLWGEKKGNGKTTWACSIANSFIRKMVSKTDLSPIVYFIKTAKFLEEMRQQFNSPTEEFPNTLALIEKVPLLIIDDLGAEKPSDWVKERLLSIIDERYSNKLSTIYTSNCSPNILLMQLGDRIYDRVRDSKTYEFKCSSWRGGNE